MKNYKSDKPCEACGESRDGYVCYHHIKSRGSGGSDHPFNLMSLCQQHHNEIHMIGLYRFAFKYKIDMELKGWTFVPHPKERHPKLPHGFGGWHPPQECYIKKDLSNE